MWAQNYFQNNIEILHEPALSMYSLCRTDNAKAPEAWLWERQWHWIYHMPSICHPTQVQWQRKFQCHISSSIRTVVFTTVWWWNEKCAEEPVLQGVSRTVLCAAKMQGDVLFPTECPFFSSKNDWQLWLVRLRYIMKWGGHFKDHISGICLPMTQLELLHVNLTFEKLACTAFSSGASQYLLSYGISGRLQHVT
jgi:hypothetical protein